MTDHPVVLFHNPFSRSAVTRALLEELAIAYEICPIDFRREEQRSPEYLAINPLGKVPAIRCGETIVTETVAIFIWLADRVPEAGLAPAIDEPDRGAYLRWLVFYAACFEPALTDRALKREPGPHAQSPYGSFDEVLATVRDALGAGPYLLGERFSAADVLWGRALGWAVGFGLVPGDEPIGAYVQRIAARPAQQRAAEADAALAREMGLER